MMLTEDWKINIDEMKLQPEYSCLKHLEQEPEVKTLMRFDNFHKKEVPVQYYSGDFILPKGTLLKIIDITFWSVREKHAYKSRRDSVRVEVLETSLAFKVDNEVVKTPTGRISKKKKDRPTIWLDLTPDQAATFEFEFSV